MSTFEANFPTEEYDRRINRTRRTMADRGLDMIVVTDPSNMSWLSGYDGWSFYVHQAVLLKLEGEPIWWGRAMDAVGAGRTVFMAYDRIVGYDDTYVQNPDKHPMETLARLIDDEGGGRRASASRPTITITPPPPMRRCSSICRRPRSSIPPGW